MTPIGGHNVQQKKKGFEMRTKEVDLIDDSGNIDMIALLANIRLCDAAPDLLSAAEQSLSDMEWIQSTGPRGTNLQSSILLLRSAIAKARGE